MYLLMQVTEEPVSFERTKVHALYVFVCVLLGKDFKRLLQITVQKLTVDNGISRNTV